MRLPTPLLRFAALLLLPSLRLAGADCDDAPLRIHDERRADDVVLLLETTHCTDLTLTLTADLQNMTPSRALPLTIDTRDHASLEVVKLSIANPGAAWRYNYRYTWVYGARGGKPDGTVYELPYPAGNLYTLIQGYGGKFSHQVGSSNHFADDWAMPAGSPVLAARGGIVVGVRQDSTSGGRSENFKSCANYVIIRHSDGTYAEYLHLKPQGVLVSLGEEVKTGQRIALSGNTGYSSGPHLHFAVFRILEDGRRQTLPVDFHVRNGSVQSLEQGSNY